MSEQDVPGKLNKGEIRFSGVTPMQLSELDESQVSRLTDEQRTMVQAVGATLRAYTQAAKDLLGGTYSSIRDLAPVHLADPGNILAICCPEGVTSGLALRQTILVSLVNS